MVNQRMFNPKMEMISRNRLEKLQLQRLKQTIKDVYEKVPFYRNRLDQVGVSPNDIKELKDIHRLPFTTKEDLRRNYPFNLSAVPLKDLVEIHASSGTTGTPTVALYNRNDIENWTEIMARCLVMSGLTKEDVFQVTAGFGMFVGGFGFFHGARKVGAAIVPHGTGYSKRQIKLMRDFGTTMLAGIVSYPLRLAEVALEEGIDLTRDLKVRKGIFGAEMWTEEVKKRIAQTWDMDVYDVYGLTEAGGNGTGNDCFRHDGFHVWEDQYFWEIIDPKSGEPVEPEETGEIVFTTLTKQAMPLIRYRTGDIAYWYDTLTCDCGRTHKRHSWIKGRLDDMVKVNGVSIWPSTVESVLMKNKQVGKEYQLIIEKAGSLDRFRVIVESAESLNAMEKTVLAKKINLDLREVILLRADVDVKDPGALPREAGKVKKLFDNRRALG